MPSDHKNMYIVCLEMGYFFWYDRVKGFGPRKKKFLKNKMGEILQQTFVCFREGKHMQQSTFNCQKQPRISGSNFYDTVEDKD